MFMIKHDCKSGLTEIFYL